MSTLHCDCGGALHETILDTFDFSAFAGLQVVLCEVPGLRCDRCGGDTLPGSVIDFTMDCLAVEMVRSPERLTAEEARYLRKHLGLSQKALAERIGIYRETVAKWECGDSEISPQHDYILRGLAIGHLREFADLWDELGSVRVAPPPRQRTAHKFAQVAEKMAANPAYRDRMGHGAPLVAG